MPETKSRDLRFIDDLAYTMRRHIDSVLNETVHSDNGRWITYRNPNKLSGTPPLMKGVKGNTFMTPGYVYAPYIPMAKSPVDQTILDYLKNKILGALGIPKKFIMGVDYAKYK